MKAKQDYPLVTFALFSYNQEKYISDAVEAALTQDYPNLEIIISDDCSSDRTYDIAKSLLVGQQSRVTIRKNDRNLGVAAHINKIMSISKGELIVVAAGDDISQPDRCSSIVSAWLSADKIPDSVCSSVVLIDQDGRYSGEASCDGAAALSKDLFSGRRWMIGSSHAWTRRAFDSFGELPEWLVAEDKVIGFRSFLLGGILYVNRPLVKYRCHSDSISSKNSLLQKTRQSLLNLKAHERDLIAAPGIIGGRLGRGELVEMGVAVEKEIKRANARVVLFADSTMVARLFHIARNWVYLSARDVLRAYKWRDNE